MQLNIKRKRKNAFTFMELMVVIILIGVIAAFAMPNYDKSIRKAHEQDIREQLKALHAANLMYNAGNGTYWDTAGAAVTDISMINNTLGMHLISNDGTAYAYTGAAGGSRYTATATWKGYRIDVTQVPLSTTGTFNPCCGTSNCLSISSCP